MKPVQRQNADPGDDGAYLCATGQIVRSPQMAPLTDWAYRFACATLPVIFDPVRRHSLTFAAHFANVAGTGLVSPAQQVRQPSHRRR